MGSIVYKLRFASLCAVQDYLVELNGFSARVVDPNFAKLPPKARKQLARNRQKRVRRTTSPQTVCICGASEKLERHHIMPPRFGGTNVRENIRWVCHNCHVKLHGGE